MTEQTPLPATANLLRHYVPRDQASVDHNIPVHLIEYWMSQRRVRIAEFKKEGEGKRSIYVNTEDVKRLKYAYYADAQSLSKSGDVITFDEALSLYPILSQTTLYALVRECHLECYIVDALNIGKTLIRHTGLKQVLKKLQMVSTVYNHMVYTNPDLVKRDINGMIRRILYLATFFNEFRQYKYCPIEAVHNGFITIVRYKNTRLQYREGFNLVDIILSGEFSGLIKEGSNCQV